MKILNTSPVPRIKESVRDKWANLLMASVYLFSFIRSVIVFVHIVPTGLKHLALTRTIPVFNILYCDTFCILFWFSATMFWYTLVPDAMIYTVIQIMISCNIQWGVYTKSCTQTMWNKLNNVFLTHFNYAMYVYYVITF